jgi:transcriptional regulator PpsR
MAKKPKQKTDESRQTVMQSADIASAMLKQTADWIFEVSRDGTLLNIAHQSEEQGVDFGRWQQKPFTDTVTIESRPKIEDMLAHDSEQPSRWRQVNHPLPKGPDIPVRYSALSIDADKVMLVGQSVLELAEMQQRLIKAQQALESDFAKMAQAKTRYQLLFDLSAEALLTLDVNTLKINEANPAAQRLLGKYIAPLKNSRFPSGFDKDSTAALDALLLQAQHTGRADDVAVGTSDGRSSFLASAALLRDRSQSTLMIRLSPIGETASENVERQTTALFDALVSKSPDGIVICDEAGLIVSANESFTLMTQLPSASRLVGKPLDNWLGRSALDHRLLTKNVREQGAIPKFSTVISGDHGTNIDVEISAAEIADPRFPYMLLVIRDVQSRLPSSEELRVPAPGAPLKELVGRVPLKELVRESTDLIEKLCIESALEMTSDNRASAAEMLGVSRQSLYTKLRRFGIADSAVGPD